MSRPKVWGRVWQSEYSCDGYWWWNAFIRRIGDSDYRVMYVEGREPTRAKARATIRNAKAQVAKAADILWRDADA